MKKNFTKEQEHKSIKGLCVISGCNLDTRPGRYVCSSHSQKIHRFRNAYNYAYPVYERLCKCNGLVPLSLNDFKNKHNKQIGLYPPYL